MGEKRSLSFDDLFIRVEQDPAYWVDRAILSFTDELARVMEDQQVSRAELARRIGSSQAYVTKVLNSRANFTIASMVKLARAIGTDVRFHLASQASRTVWLDEMLDYSSYSVTAGPEQATIDRSWAAPGPLPEGDYRPVTPSPKDHDVAFSLAA